MTIIFLESLEVNYVTNVYLFFRKNPPGRTYANRWISFTVLGGNGENMKNTVLGYKKGSKIDDQNIFEKFGGELC